MKKFVIAVLATLSLLATQAFAGEDKRIEVSVMSGNAGVSGSPISDIGLDASTGTGIRFIGDIPDYTGWQYTVGLSQRKYNIVMGGVSLDGGPDSTTVDATVRRSFDFSVGEYSARAYLGGGLHNTDLSSTSLANGVLSLNSASITGVVTEVGVEVPFKKGVHPILDNMYVGLSARQYYGEAKDMKLELAGFGLLVNTLSIKDPVTYSFSIGKSF